MRPKLIAAGSITAAGLLLLLGLWLLLHNQTVDVSASDTDQATPAGQVGCVIAPYDAGLFGNDDELIDALEAAGRRADDRAWPMPIGDEYGDQLKSNFADFANVAGREGGAITAACFLAKFTDGLKWAHLDVAGTAYQGGAAKGSTGRPVPLLVDYLLNK